MLGDAPRSSARSTSSRSGWSAKRDGERVDAGRAARVHGAAAGTSVPAATTSGRSGRIVEDRLQRGAAARRRGRRAERARRDPTRQANRRRWRPCRRLVLGVVGVFGVFGVLGVLGASVDRTGLSANSARRKNGSSSLSAPSSSSSSSLRAARIHCQAAAIAEPERGHGQQRRRRRRRRAATGDGTDGAQPAVAERAAALPAEHEHEQPGHQRRGERRSRAGATSPSARAARRATTRPASSGVSAASAPHDRVGARAGRDRGEQRERGQRAVRGARTGATCVPVPTAKPGPGQVGRAGDHGVRRGQHAEQQDRDAADPAADLTGQGFGHVVVQHQRAGDEQRARREVDRDSGGGRAQHASPPGRDVGARTTRAARTTRTNAVPPVAANSDQRAEPDAEERRAGWCRAWRTGRRPGSRR